MIANVKGPAAIFGMGRNACSRAGTLSPTRQAAPIEHIMPDPMTNAGIGSQRQAQTIIATTRTVAMWGIAMTWLILMSARGFSRSVVSNRRVGRTPTNGISAIVMSANHLMKGVIRLRSWIPIKGYVVISLKPHAAGLVFTKIPPSRLRDQPCGKSSPIRCRTM